MTNQVSKPRRKTLWWVLAVVVAAFAIGGIANSISSSTPELPPLNSDTFSEPTYGDTPVAAAPAPPAQEGVAEGMWAVGTDMPAGTYRTMGAVDSVVPNCYWERLSGTSGEFQDIITNGNTTAPHTVTLNAGEWFNSTGCQPWQKVG
jgi:hypothetical protein